MESIENLALLRFIIYVLCSVIVFIGTFIFFVSKSWLSKRDKFEEFTYNQFRENKSDRDDQETRITVIEKVCEERHGGQNVSK